MLNVGFVLYATFLLSGFLSFGGYMTPMFEFLPYVCVLLAQQSFLSLHSHFDGSNS